MREFKSYAGADVTGTINRAIVEAQTNKDSCTFNFNGVSIVVSGESDRGLIYRDWSRGMSGYLGKNPTVGPEPTPHLSDVETENDAKIEAANNIRRQKEQAEYDKEQAAATAALAGALSVAEPIELRDTEAWQQFVENNKDAYGGRCVRFAEEWARLMQTRIANGETIAACTDELSHLADDDGISGFMHGAAISMLSKCWKHGEDLRLWHNLDTQIASEGVKANKSGGVLNPAVLRLSNRS